MGVSLTPERGVASGEAPPADFDRSITSVVIVGTGVAGVTTADFVRRGHPDCEIHLIGAEPHLLYNRMGISRVVYGRSAMTGLSLLDEQWYDDNRITTWQNTLATEVDLARRVVVLGTGQRLFFDRLVLATGSRATTPLSRASAVPAPSSSAPPRTGRGSAPTCSSTGVRSAVVAGGGLLGLEAAHALGQLGLRVTVLERGDRLLARNIDRRASQLVHQHLTRVGVDVRSEDLRRCARGWVVPAAGASRRRHGDPRRDLPRRHRDHPQHRAGRRGGHRRRPRCRSSTTGCAPVRPASTPSATRPSTTAGCSGSGRSRRSRPRSPPPTCSAVTSRSRATCRR